MDWSQRHDSHAPSSNFPAVRILDLLAMSDTSPPTTQKQWSWNGPPNGFDGLKLRDSAIPHPGVGEGACSTGPSLWPERLPRCLFCQFLSASTPCRSTIATLPFRRINTLAAFLLRIASQGAMLLVRLSHSATEPANGRPATGSRRPSFLVTLGRESRRKLFTPQFLAQRIQPGHCYSTGPSLRLRWSRYQRP